MNVEALLRTADLVETAKPSSFNMQYYRSEYYRSVETHACGSVFCAVGLAIEHGLFPGYEWEGSEGPRILIHDPSRSLHVSVSTIPSLVIDSLYDFKHADGVKSNLARAIFYPCMPKGPYWCSCPTQSQVAAVLRHVAANSDMDEEALAGRLFLSRVHPSGQLEALPQEAS